MLSTFKHNSDAAVITWLYVKHFLPTPNAKGAFVFIYMASACKKDLLLNFHLINNFYPYIYTLFLSLSTALSPLRFNAKLTSFYGAKLNTWKHFIEIHVFPGNERCCLIGSNANCSQSALCNKIKLINHFVLLQLSLYFIFSRINTNM
jgi:hypothetical protein